MFGLFKLKKKSKKDKNKTPAQDDEKENTSSPTKVKKIENTGDKSDSDAVKVEEQTPINITVEGHNTPSVPRKASAGRALTIETANLNSPASHGSPLSSATTTLNIHQARCPMLSASDAHTNSFVRGNYLSSTISGSDLHRFLNSGYMNGDPYLQRGVELKTPKSPHFHRPPNFSYTHGPRYVTPHQRHMSANRVSASSSDAPRYNRTHTPSGITRNRSSSPAHFLAANQKQSETVEHITKEDGSTAIVTTIRSTRSPVARDLDTEEPIRLAKYPGGHQPDPSEEARIESLDWPSPPYPAAVPELRARSRSSSNRRAPSTINSIHGTHATSVNGDVCEEADSEDENDFVNDEEVQQVLTQNTSYLSHENNRQSTGAHSVASSLARVKASRPNSKLRYHNNLFDNDYDDYMLRYKADKDWRKMLNKSTLSRTFGDSSVVGGCDSDGDIHSNTNNNESMTQNEMEEMDDEMKEASEATKASEESAEVKKIRTQSGMAAELFSEVEAQQKRLLAHKLRVDPWKASRSPNAKEIPSVRTRYESPVNASPSRVYNYHNRSLMTSAMSGHTMSPTPLQSQTASATFIGDISLVNNTPVTPTHQAYNNDVAMTQAPNMAHQPLTPKSVNSLGRTNIINNQLFTSNSSNRVISSSCLPKAGLNSTSNSIVYNMAVPRPGYGLTSTNKSITLPNSARYVGFTPNIYDYAGSNRCTSPVSCSEQTYPYEILRRNKEKKPVLPADVDRERLERHLGAEEFQQLFGMNRDQFYELPEWQRVNLKKRVKLF